MINKVDHFLLVAFTILKRGRSSHGNILVGFDKMKE